MINKAPSYCKFIGWFWLRLTGDYPPFEHCCREHDYDYFDKEFTREDSDRLFYECLLCNGVNRVAAWVMHRSVRLFGWLFWR